MKIVINHNFDKVRLDAFLSKYIEQSRSKISAFIDNGFVLVNSTPQKSSYKLKNGDIVEYNDDSLNDYLNEDKPLVPFDFQLDIIYEDEYLLIINKPKDIIVHPTKYEREKTISNALLNHCDKLSDVSGKDRLGIVHRLDKNTSGLMICAKDNKVHENLAKQIKEKTLKRKYMAIAIGVFEDKVGIIDKPLLHYLKDDVKMVIDETGKGLEAITHYKVVEQYKDAALVELELKTGRTHQIRCHLASINHPVFGDKLYGGSVSKIKTQQQLLQSYYISFVHPITNKKMEFELKENEFSADFIKVLNILRRNNGN